MLFVGLAGCNKAPPLPTLAAGGTVTYGGKPVDGAMVTFQPVDREKGKPAFGTTNSQGRFKLETSSGGANRQAGALAGEYEVAVTKMKIGGGSTPDPSSMKEESQGKEMMKKMVTEQTTPPEKMTSESQGREMMKGKAGGQTPKENELPKKYENAANSGLKFTVKSGDKNDFTIELTD